MNTSHNAPRTGEDAHTPTPFDIACELSYALAGIDEPTRVKKHVATVRLIQAAIEARDRMHNERHAALVAALEGFLKAMKGNSSDLAEAAFEAKRVLADARNT